MSESKGVIKRWDDAKGFGFVRPASGGEDVFAHISAVRGERRPRLGDEVLYLAQKDSNGRLRATHLRLSGDMKLDHSSIRVKPRGQSAKDASAGSVRSSPRIKNVSSRHSLLWLKAPVFLLLCSLPTILCVQLWQLGIRWVPVVYLLASVISFLQYWIDKQSASTGRSRVSERSLHLLELMGGWPGALLAQQAFRHKTRKVSYQVMFWLIVGAHQLYWLYLWNTGLSGFPGAMRQG